MRLDYEDAILAGYVERFDRQSPGPHGRVVRGHRPFRPYVYAADGMTPLCDLCAGRIYVGIETWKLNLGEVADEVLRPLTVHEPPLRPEEFPSPTVYLCAGCGSWSAVTRVDDDPDDWGLRYVLHLAGALERFSSTDGLPAEELAMQLRLGGLRLADLTPKAFERLVARVLSDVWRDCEVQHVGVSGGRGDGGVDVVLVQEDRTHLVQIKHHPLHLGSDIARREGVKTIRELNGVLFREGIPRGIVVSSSPGYTRGAREEALATGATVDSYEMLMFDATDVGRWVSRSPAAAAAPWRRHMRPGDAPSLWNFGGGTAFFA
jgi:hypothetical protein